MPVLKWSAIEYTNLQRFLNIYGPYVKYMVPYGYPGWDKVCIVVDVENVAPGVPVPNPWPNTP